MTAPATAGAAAHVFVAALADTCTVDGSDGHHLERVRRLQTGEVVTAADGTGAWRVYEISATARGSLTLTATSAVAQEPAPAIEITLAAALTKAGLDDVVAAVTELGVAGVIPLRTERTVVRWDDARADRIVERLRTVARAAAMQSRRARIPVVHPATDLPALVGTAEVRPGLIVADRSGGAPASVTVPATAAWTVVIGPEGGFSDAEFTLMDPAPRFSVGPNVLRATTAPIAAVAVLAALAADLDQKSADS
jgi:16S rRNA (uracil1498-N3)-methyltransferase